MKLLPYFYRYAMRSVTHTLVVSSIETCAQQIYWSLQVRNHVCSISELQSRVCLRTARMLQLRVSCQVTSFFSRQKCCDNLHPRLISGKTSIRLESCCIRCSQSRTPSMICRWGNALNACYQGSYSMPTSRSS